MASKINGFLASGVNIYTHSFYATDGSAVTEAWLSIPRLRGDAMEMAGIAAAVKKGGYVSQNALWPASGHSAGDALAGVFSSDGVAVKAVGHDNAGGFVTAALASLESEIVTPYQ